MNVYDCLCWSNHCPLTYHITQNEQRWWVSVVLCCKLGQLSNSLWANYCDCHHVIFRTWKTAMNVEEMRWNEGRWWGVGMWKINRGRGSVTAGTDVDEDVDEQAQVQLSIRLRAAQVAPTVTQEEAAAAAGRQKITVWRDLWGTKTTENYQIINFSHTVSIDWDYDTCLPRFICACVRKHLMIQQNIGIL